MPDETWDSFDTTAGIQVVPPNDIIDHLIGGQLCICDPKVEKVQRRMENPGAMRRVITHNIYDTKET